MKKLALALALSIAAGSTAMAANQLDGDNNPIPGAQIEMEGLLANTYASVQPYAAQNRAPATVIVRKQVIDGDGNPIPGVH